MNNDSFSRVLDVKLMRHLLESPAENSSALVTTLKNLSCDAQTLMGSMAWFAYITAGYDLDNPLSGTLLERYRSSLGSMKRMESEEVSKLIGMSNFDGYDRPSADTLSSILAQVTSEELALIEVAMDYAYFQGSPDKSAWHGDDLARSLS
jgi:hypothetical protein